MALISQFQLESAQGWIAQPAAPEWGGGTKSPEQTPEPVQKSVCPAPHTDGWTRVVTKIGTHGGQHVQAVFESDCESNEVL